jgi:hypothetical protein
MFLLFLPDQRTDTRLNLLLLAGLPTPCQLDLILNREFDSPIALAWTAP